MPSIADDIGRVPLFSGLSQRQLKKVARSFTERTYPPGRTIVREGHMDGIGFFIVSDGTAAVHVGGSRVGSLGPGDYFGELALITRSERLVTISAETEVRCLMTAFWDFRKLASENPDILWKLLEHLADVLTAERERRARAEAQRL